MLAESANKLMEELAAEFRGEVTLRMGPISPYPEMAFYHARKKVFVDCVLRPGALRLNLTMPLTPQPARRLFDLRLFGKRPWTRLLDWIGLRDGREHESDEPRSFRLWTADVSKLLHYFAGHAAFRLRELAALDAAPQLGVAWTPCRFLVQKPMREFRLDPMKFAVSQSLRLIECLGDDGVLPFRPVEVEPVIRTEGVVWDPVVGACCVCGDPLQNRVVYCGACSTPHHPDCWEYTGRCSVYACGARNCSSRMAEIG